MNQVVVLTSRVLPDTSTTMRAAVDRPTFAGNLLAIVIGAFAFAVLMVVPRRRRSAGRRS